jgi:(p)ppGpp synthase/HD superfamily hydrolase
MPAHGIIHPKSQGLIDYAYDFAKEAHGDQVRKYTGEPYINHPASVARILTSVTMDCNILAAALLHDVIEDTPVTYKDIAESGLGFPVADLVIQVTDVSYPEQGNRKLRKAIDRQYLAGADEKAQTIKLADLIDNTSSITRYDPDFAVVYMREKKLLLDVLRTKGNLTLFNIARQLVFQYENQVRSNDNEGRHQNTV